MRKSCTIFKFRQHIQFVNHGQTKTIFKKFGFENKKHVTPNELCILNNKINLVMNNN